MSAPAVPASRMLNAYIKDHLAPVLLGAGFKAAGRVYRRPAGDAVQVVDIQNWKYNDARRARFTVEVGVCFPRLLTAVSELGGYAFYRESLGRPGITECAARRRIGEFLDPPQDIWWTVSATTGHLPAVEDVLRPLTTAALPWLQGMSTVAALAPAGPGRHALTSVVMEVAALFALGRPTAAADAARSLARARHPTQPALEGALLAELLSLEKLRCGDADGAPG